mmetsp:Transcript_32729/g.100788  ORF Transcript_32729/g.100788 Transcript_32729/m.100788 type:complete len:277 (-) Transcript_32729:11-841(-)
MAANVAKLARSESTVDRFSELSAKDPVDQCEFFLKSFIFALGDGWKDVPNLCTEYQKHAKATGPTDDSMNHIQAADFLQRHGKTRTGIQRKHEVADVDLNHDGQISFIEYLILHYKVMILKEYYARHEKEPEEDLSTDGVGVVDVGGKLVEELFTMPAGLSPQLEAALEAFAEDKKKREAKIKELTEKADKGGVKGMAAKQELRILESGDTTEMNRIELTLAAAKRKASKKSGADALQAERDKEEKAAKAEADAKKAKMKARMAMFGGGGPVAPKK